jgi:hypothetical protein
MCPFPQISCLNLSKLSQFTDKSNELSVGRDGVQRFRCFPFNSDKAWRCNPRQYVAVIPPKKYTGIRFKRFDMAEPDATHRRKLWYGRVELFFRCSFRRVGGQVFHLDLALLSFLQDFKCPDAQTILQTEGGARMFYVSDTPWICVLPINHILGRVPLMKVYLGGSSSPTIPSALSQHKQAHFRYGHADRNGNEGSGSPLYMLNVHLWQFGRPQPRTISVEERRGNRERARKALNQKRAQRQPYIQEKAAVVIGRGLTPVKILFRLRLQKHCPRRKSTTTCKGTDHGLTPKLNIYMQKYNK